MSACAELQFKHMRYTAITIYKNAGVDNGQIAATTQQHAAIHSAALLHKDLE